MNNTTTPNAIETPQHFIKFSCTRQGNGSGTRDFGAYQIHSSLRLFNVLAVKQPDGTFVGNYHGGFASKQRLLNEKNAIITAICSLYNVGGQSLTCDDGVQLEDGSWLYNGSYDCWSD